MLCMQAAASDWIIITHCCCLPKNLSVFSIHLCGHLPHVLAHSRVGGVVASIQLTLVRRGQGPLLLRTLDDATEETALACGLTKRQRQRSHSPFASSLHPLSTQAMSLSKISPPAGMTAAGVLYPAALITFMVRHGLSKKSLSKSGALAAAFVGLGTFTNTPYAFSTVLLTFYLSSSRLTKACLHLNHDAWMSEGLDPSTLDTCVHDPSCQHYSASIGFSSI